MRMRGHRDISGLVSYALGFASGRGARMSRGQAGVCDLGFGMVTNVFRGAGTMS